MSERHVSSVLVVDEGQGLQGIVTERDILHLVAQDAGALGRRLGDRATSPGCRPAATGHRYAGATGEDEGVRARGNGLQRRGEAG